MLTFTKNTDPKLYDGGHLMRSIGKSYDEMVELLGKPSFINGEGEFPDDNFKCDVLWSLIADNGDIISIWNYKNGPAYSGCELYDIDGFSSYSNNVETLEEFINQLNNGNVNLQNNDNIFYTELNGKIKILEDNGYKVNIYQKIISDRLNSLWYDGCIADITNKGGKTISLYATGSIKLYDENQNLIYDGKERGNGLPFNFNTATDEDLKIAIELANNLFISDMNWFSISLNSDENNDIVIDNILDFFEIDIFDNFIEE